MNDMTSMSDPTSALGLGPGSVIAGRYEVVKLLGSGGFAAVFQAYDREIERQVAIKVLNIAAVTTPGTEMGPFLERFRREAKLAARIRHSNVVEIHDFGVLEGKAMPYIIMEMLEGHDLQDEVKMSGGMAPERALPLFLGALEALGEAHRHGIVHKDIKPANLFISRPATRNEMLKVVDFGIAHMGGNDESRMTQTGAMFGTPQYLSPEYVQTQTVGPQMDVYQMALVLVEMLTGRTVVDDENPWQCALKHATGDLAIPTIILDGPLGPVIAKALEFDPIERYPDALAFADALAKIDPTHIGDGRDPQGPRRVVETKSAPINASQSAQIDAAQAARNSNPATLAVDSPDFAVGEQPNASRRVTAELEAPKKSKKPLIIAVLVVLVLGIGGTAISLTYWLDFPAGERLWNRVMGEESTAQATPKKPVKKPAKKVVKKKAPAKKKVVKTTSTKKAAPKKAAPKKAAPKKAAPKKTAPKEAAPKPKK